MQALRPAVYPNPQRASQSMPNASISSGSFLTQHPTLPSYSQPTHPSGHYPPSAAIRQAYSGSNAFHPSPAMLHRARTRYMIPRATNIPGRYGGTRSTLSASRVGYEGALGSQFVGVNRFLPPRQVRTSILHYLLRCLAFFRVLLRLFLFITAWERSLVGPSR